jgi:hypothetical protein
MRGLHQGYIVLRVLFSSFLRPQKMTICDPVYFLVSPEPHLHIPRGCCKCSACGVCCYADDTFLVAFQYHAAFPRVRVP